jgi:ATP-dependent phosphofructokinase / diphosphate-dependent phosphofructokinase
MTKYIGVLTAGGDSPGLNAAIRGLAKAAQGVYGFEAIGFRDGFRGLMENRTIPLDRKSCSGILTVGGTILGTSRDKPHAMNVGGKVLDMTDVLVENYRRLSLDALVCLGGGGTQKNAFHLAQRGLNVITLPKTIDNDVAGTDTTFGFDTALGIATEAIDRLHSTAHSHHRIVIVEIMGHRVGWLALGAGISGGADVILIPEIRYDVNKVAEAIRWRSREGKSFSIVAVAEGARPKGAEESEDLKKGKKKKEGENGDHEGQGVAHTITLAERLEELTGLETRVTILGHLQRGGTPSAADRLLATRLGTACAGLINKGTYGVMVAVRGDGFQAVPLAEIVGKRKNVPLDHPWLESARHVGTCFGD